MARKYIGPGGKNPWGLRITPFHQRLAAVTPEEVTYWAGPGLEEAQAAFSKISTETMIEHNGKIYKGGEKPFIFSKSLKTEAGAASGIPELQGYSQIVHYQRPSTSSGIEGCNTCGFETAGCSSACFAHGGQMGLPQGLVAQLSRTKMAFQNAAQFLGLGYREIADHADDAIEKGLIPIHRWGGTSEGLVHLIKANEALRDLPSHEVVYSKAQSRDVVPKDKLITNPDPDKLTLVTSVTENTTIPRMKQASEEQGQALAVPTTRAPHSRYPAIARMVDRQGRRADFPSLLVPSTINERGFGESLGDASDFRNLDKPLSGITGGVLYLGGKKSRFVDESGTPRHAVIGQPFIREVDPSRQIMAFQAKGIFRNTAESAIAEGTAEPVSSRPTPVTIRSSRSQAFRGD